MKERLCKVIVNLKLERRELIQRCFWGHKRIAERTQVEEKWTAWYCLWRKSS